jgi:sulfite oxidase
MAAKRPDSTVHQREPLNLEPHREALAAEAITPLDAFYVRSHGGVSNARSSGWRLRVDGLVERELDLTVSELRERFTATEVVATLCCAGNRRSELGEVPGEVPWGPGAIGNARWRGVRLADVLEAAGVDGDASDVAFTGADEAMEIDPPEPFGASISIEKATSPEVLLAWEMNAHPLPAEHGAPLRVMVPGYTGARSVKWLTRITVQDAPSQNHFQAESYRVFPADADPDSDPRELGIPLNELKVNSAILAPVDGQHLEPGSTAVSGYALVGGGRRVERVDVSVDGGASWRQAELLDDLGPWAWRRWRATVDLRSGPHEIVARAWDSAAAQQPERMESTWNPNGYANDAWARVRVDVGEAR